MTKKDNISTTPVGLWGAWLFIMSHLGVAARAVNHGISAVTQFIQSAPVETSDKCEKPRKTISVDTYYILDRIMTSFPIFIDLKFNSNFIDSLIILLKVTSTHKELLEASLFCTQVLVMNRTTQNSKDTQLGLTEVNRLYTEAVDGLLAGEAVLKFYHSFKFFKLFRFNSNFSNSIKILFLRNPDPFVLARSHFNIQALIKSYREAGPHKTECDEALKVLCNIYYEALKRAKINCIIRDYPEMGSLRFCDEFMSCLATISDERSSVQALRKADGVIVTFLHSEDSQPLRRKLSGIYYDQLKRSELRM